MSLNKEEYIEEYLKTICKYLKIDINIEINQEDNVFNININSSNNAVLIGKYGRNLKALSVLLKESIKSNYNEKVIINIDVKNYNKNKEIKFNKKIDEIIEDVLNSHLNIKLYNLNSYERRIIHEKVKNYKELDSVSQGENKDRFITIIYKG